MQIVAQVVSIAITVVAVALFVRAIGRIVGVVRIGRPARRTDQPAARAVTLLRESLGHTRMLQWRWVGAGHWFVFVGFGLLFFTLVTAFGQLFHADYALPIVGRWFLWEWVSELFTTVMLVAIVAFIVYRRTRPRERVRGPRGRFFGSTMWQGYFVEAVILLVGLCIAVLRGAEYAIAPYGDHPDHQTALHFPFSSWIGDLLGGLSESQLANLIYLTAMVKILVSFAWMITISLTPTMGVAWHRFLAFFNIYFKRDPHGRTSLGALQPITVGGEAVDFEELDEDVALGIGAVEDFSWKGILDFTTCTECGRCQSQCPAWNTDKPLSPKLLITGLRDHAHAKAPYVQAASEEARAALPAGVLAEAERPLVGATEGEWAWAPEGGAVIDDDVLWSCTSCGACVQQCPVDIEHVDHIVDMRRYQVLVESNFPAELNGLFRGLENKGNPWNMAASARLDWAKDLPFEVKVVGEDVDSLDEVEWLFWVGCAGAYEDRAKKTTRAVAELLDMAGVSFAVLGNGETCTGDPARRAGNEFVFQGLAAQNAETLRSAGARKVVATCAHCFNTLKNEYSQLGVQLEVVHHTQLLNRLVRDKRLTPMRTDSSRSWKGPHLRPITYHDPCYLGRHNQVYSPPRELLAVIPDTTYVEMPRNSERSFCCGAGGARMWMEEKLGERINMNRTTEAVRTGADQIAVGCPFCRVMLSDGLTMMQSQEKAREEVEVLDVAQLLLAAVKGEAAAPARARSEETRPEPVRGDATQTAATVTATEDVGPAAEASGGTSLFDEPQPSAPSRAGSLFDVGKESPEPTPATPAPSAGSLFDVGEPASEPTPDPTPANAEPQADVTPTGGSLFDVGEPPAEPAPADVPEDPAGDSTTDGPTDRTKDDADTTAAPTNVIPEGGSLFDLGEPEPAPAPTRETQPAAETPTAPSVDVIPEGRSLFDLDQPAEPASADPPEDPAGDSTTDGPTDRGADDADTSTPPTSAPSSDVIPEGRSLFDIDEPAAEPTPADIPEDPAGDSTTDAPTDRRADAADSSTAPSTDVIPEDRSLFDIDEPAAEPTPADVPEDPAGDSTTDGPTDRRADDAAADDPPQARKDAKIDEATSLFDL